MTTVDGFVKELPVSRQEYLDLLMQLSELRKQFNELNASQEERVRQAVDKVDRRYQERLWANYPDATLLKSLMIKFGVCTADEFEAHVKEMLP